jgi:hypothetical protein
LLLGWSKYDGLIYQRDKVRVGFLEKAHSGPSFDLTFSVPDGSKKREQRGRKLDASRKKPDDCSSELGARGKKLGRWH